MNNPLSAIPAKYRTYVYVVLALIGLALGATQAGFAAVGAANPQWLVAALAVVPFVMSGLGLTAATHVPAAPDAQAEAAPLDAVNHAEYRGDSLSE